jgi:gamma-glutamyl-gamma-aminobutyrate hydrolase PuuD
MITFYVAKGDWPLKLQEYSCFFERLGYQHGEENSDFLVLPGGADLGVRKNRDDYERRILEEYQNRKVVGICKGFQLAGVEFGASLLEHIPDLELPVHHGTLSSDWKGKSCWHRTQKGFITNTRHHQGFLEMPGWEILDSTEDGIVESASFHNFFGVQWHPEKEEMKGSAAEEWFAETLSHHLNK